MNFPVILPTGAMASGQYTDYMISYNTLLTTYLIDRLGGCYGVETISDWENIWDRMLSDVNSEVVTLTKCVSDIQAKLTMIQNSL